MTIEAQEKLLVRIILFSLFLLAALVGFIGGEVHKSYTFEKEMRCNTDVYSGKYIASPVARRCALRAGTGILEVNCIDILNWDEFKHIKHCWQ